MILSCHWLPYISLNTIPYIGKTLLLLINTSLLPATKFFSFTFISVIPCSNTHNKFP
nr:MAG TPA: hypothetical protein [Caudoviricetes sp.]